MITKINKCIFITITVIISYIVGSSTYAADPLQMSFDFYNLKNADGLSHSSVTCITQDQHKLLWIGTEKGLNRYDGNKIESYYSDNTPLSLPHNKINSLLYSEKNKLFIGTEEGLCVYQDSLLNFLPLNFQGKSLAKIHSITPFNDHQIIVASNKGVFKISDTKKEYKVEKISSKTEVRGVLVDAFYHIWFFTKEQVFYTSPEMSVIDSYEIQQPGTKELASITAGFIDTKGDIWIGTEYNGLFKFDRKRQKFDLSCKGDISKGTHLKYIRCINEDQYNRLWIGTENGLFIYNGDKENIAHFTQSFDITENSINDNAIYDIYNGEEGIIWLGTYFGGVNYTSLFSTGFYNMIPDGGKVSLKGKAVSSILEDRQHQLWIGTEDKGISVFNHEKKTFKYLSHSTSNKNSISGNNVHALIEDPEGYIWAGTYLDGLNRIHPKNFSIQVFKQDDNKNSISDNSIYALHIDQKKEMYIGGLDGVDIYNFKTKKFRRFKEEQLGGKHIDDIVEDRKGNIWFSSYVSGLYRYNKEEDRLYQYTSSKVKLSSNSFISSLIDSKNRLWFGTRNGGLVQYDYKKDVFKIYDAIDGNVDIDVYGILEDADRFLWLSTNKGIYKFNPLTEKVVTNYTTTHGLIANQFNFKSYYNNHNGTLYFGAVNGLTYFNPKEIFSEAFMTAPVFTDIKSSNERIQTDSTLQLPPNINYAELITLESDKNEISFGFTLPTFHPIVHSQYQYKLDGFDEEWRKLENKFNQISYTNLDPGKYTFRVRFSYDGNAINNVEKNIEIEILPHPLNTPLAYLIYGLLIIGIGYVVYKLLAERRRKKTQSKIEQIEETKKIELDEHKMNFFTNISHEFKTPLTIILALIEDITEDLNPMPEGASHSFKTMEKNALRLKFLISQLMEFRQIETDHAPMHLSKFDVLAQIQTIYNSFSVLYDKKEITGDFVTSIEAMNMVSDEDKIEKIFSNILSNAYKYANRGGKICVNIQMEQKDLVVKISNTGRLLSKEDQQRIFDPFFRKGQSIHNTGIGMAIVKKLTTLLSGEVGVETDDVLGNSILVRIPTEYFSEKDINTARTKTESNFTKELIVSIADDDQREEKPVEKQNYSILIAEDNPDLSRHIKAHLGKYYNVRLAHNGVEALELMEKEKPDLVISDVLMPKMKGTELCEKIKESPDYSHIPVILLTALSSELDKIEGLKHGADSYMSKPFSFEELKVKINNLLESKNRLKNHFKETGLMTETQKPTTNKDEELIKSIHILIKENIENENFGVEQLADQLNLSRSVLYVKIKEITGMSTVDFLNTIKLKMAIDLLLTTNMSIGEIAFKTGYREANYFSRVFKKFHKMSPSQFRKAKKKEAEEQESETV